jgi:hypothetical protein
MQQGYVEKIWENQREGKRYWTLRIDGERYTCWDPKIVEGVQEGSLVAYQYKQQNKYRHLTELNLVSSSSEPYKEREVRMIRMSALRSAVTLLSEVEELEYKERVKTTLQTARYFERYILGSDEQSRKEKESSKSSSKE